MKELREAMNQAKDELVLALLNFETLVPTDYAEFRSECFNALQARTEVVRRLCDAISACAVAEMKTRLGARTE